MKKLMIILQNAYGVEEGYEPSFEKESFSNCHSGRRLSKAIPEGVETHIINSSPKIGSEASSNFRPDKSYVSRRYREINPDIILACGRNAEMVVDSIEVSVPVIKMPHPAYRALKNRTLYYVKGRIRNG
jgi:hypothetical protein